MIWLAGSTSRPRQGGGDAATGQQAGAATEADPVSAAEGDEPVVDANFTVKDD